MAQHQHLVLTRFNLHHPRWPNFQGIDEKWLDRRFALFLDVCYPSMRAQTCQAFTWLVFFHPKTPAPHRAMIRSLVTGYPNLVPVFVPGIVEARAAARAMVDKRFLITTRLDNDDALARGHIAAIQKSFARQRMQFVNFPNGLYADSRNGAVCRHRYPANMFLSLIEDTRHSRRTVLDFDHSRVARDHKILDLGVPDPAWLVVIHGGNKTSRMRGTKADPVLLQRHFSDVALQGRTK